MNNPIICEWEFSVPPEEVDLNRLWEELVCLTVIFACSYLEQLKKNAPKTYARLREWRINEGCTIFDWS